MQFEVSADLSYTASEPGTILLSVQAQSFCQKILKENIWADPVSALGPMLLSEKNNRLVTLNISSRGEWAVSYRALVETSYQLIDHSNLIPTLPQNLDQDVFAYLHPSRYCQSDRLTRLANHEFGNIVNEFEKVVAITDWIYSHVEYLSGSTNGQTSAYDTVTQQAGVCRDFAHLGIALCRALTIPARYCSVYAYQLEPPDFHACFEAYLSGRWIMFDATRLAPLNGLVKIAIGRDAADTAISNIFGNISSKSMQVMSQLHGEELVPVFYDKGSMSGISYD